MKLLRRLFRVRSVRTRLMIWNSLALALLLGALGVVLQYTARASMLALVDRELERSIRPLIERPPRPPELSRPPIARFPPPPAPDRPPPPGPIFDRRPDPFAPPEDPRGQNPAPADTGGSRGRPLSGALRPRFLNLQGESLIRADPSEPYDPAAFAQAARGARLFTTVQWEGEPIRVLSRPFPPRGPIVGVVQAPYPLTEIQRAMAGMNRALLILLPIALFCAGMGGALLTDRVLRPVRRLSRKAAQIGAQDLSERLKVEGEDEFATLASTFNEMLARLEVSFAEQQRLIAQLQEMVAQQQRFTADASHELRTPLTIIKANTSLLLSGKPTAEEYRQGIEEVDAAAAAMSRLVQDLLLLARSDAGRLGQNRETLSVRSVLEQAAARVSSQGGAPVSIAVREEPLCVDGNGEELIRLFINLLENALRYTPPDGQITVNAERRGGQAVITVCDTGCGIAPEHLPHLGERFYRVDLSRARPDGGSGLGLSICRSIAEAHGGSIAFESRVGAGTTVIVTLPSVVQAG